MARVIAIAGQKGGTGKSTTTVNLGACLWALDQKILIVDLDPQAASTRWLGIDATDTQDANIYHLLLKEKPIEEITLQTVTKIQDGDEIKLDTRDNFDIVPADIQLAMMDQSQMEMNPHHRLRMGLEPVLDDYDFILCDCPPSLGRGTVNALVAADFAIFVFDPSIDSIIAWTYLQKVVRDIKNHYKHNVPGYSLLCRYVRNQIIDNEILQQLENTFGSANLPPIRQGQAVRQARNLRLPLNECKPKSIPALDYEAIAGEILLAAKRGEERGGLHIVKS